MIGSHPLAKRARRWLSSFVETKLILPGVGENKIRFIAVIQRDSTRCNTSGSSVSDSETEM